MVYFIPSSLSFIPAEWKDDGTYSDDSWPSDATLLTKDESDQYWKASAPGGKKLGASKNGRPKWVDIDPPSHEEQVISANAKKTSLIDDATLEISILNDAIELGEANQDEIDRCNSLKKYRVLLNRVDTSTAPDITWPVKP